MNVEQGSTLYVESATYAGNTVNPGDYTTLFFADTNSSGKLDTNDILVGADVTGAKPSMNGAVGGDPADLGNYFAMVIYGSDPYAGKHADADGNLNQYVYYQDYDTEAWYQTQPFEVVEAQKSLEGATAYQVKSDATDLSDEELKYTGDAIKFAFKANDESLDLNDYNIVWTHQTNNTAAATITDNGDGTFLVTEVGEYTAMLYGKGAYAGTDTEVTVKVSPIDLSNDVITVDMVPSSTGVTLSSADDHDVNMTDLVVRVNGDILGANGKAKLDMNALRFTHEDGTEYFDWNAQQYGQLGVWSVKVSDKNTAEAAVDVIGGPQNIDITVVGQIANLTYDGTPLVETKAGLGNGYFPHVFNNAKGTAFNENLIEAKLADGTVVPHTTTVTKDGEVVTDYTQPGEYVLTVDVPVAQQFAYGAHMVTKFTVIAKHISDVDVYLSIDGKSYSKSVEYTGSAIVPTVSVKEGTKTLTAGEDYTVSYRVKGGDTVESMVDPGNYEVVVSFPGSDRENDPYVVDLTITKATIESAEATAPYFALPADGSAAVPTFTGWTNANLKGNSFALAADDIDVAYYPAEWSNNGTWWTQSDDKWVIPADAERIDAADLTKAGDYMAVITLKSTCETLMGADVQAYFQLADAAGYADVDANQWYADEVYQAKEFGYMTGIPGTNLFLPNGEISRAQTAQVLYNMAGGNLNDWDIYPSEFTDVAADAWYAEPVFWASQADIVTGYGDTGLFGPNDDVTREQAATMLYRYMQTQGKDVSATADLSAYADAASVSDWAAEAMQWAVANDVFGVGTDLLRPQDNLSRAEMAAIAVRVQPDGIVEAM